MGPLMIVHRLYRNSQGHTDFLIRFFPRSHFLSKHSPTGCISSFIHTTYQHWFKHTIVSHFILLHDVIIHLSRSNDVNVIPCSRSNLCTCPTCPWSCSALRDQYMTPIVERKLTWMGWHRWDFEIWGTSVLLGEL